MGKCCERADNGNRCPRDAKQLNGRCGKCHGLTTKWKQCSKPANRGKYCTEESHKTLEQIQQREAARKERRNKKRRAAYASSPSASRPGQPSHEARGSRQAGSASRSRSPGNGRTGRRKPKELSKKAKREAAELCAAVIRGENVFDAVQDQLTDYIGEQVMEALAEHWDGKQCEELAKIARGLLGVKGYSTKILQIALNWLMLKAGFGDMARLIVCQLVIAIPTPWNAKLVAAARVIQATGICLCFSQDRLMECRCLHDLVQLEGMQAIGRLLTAAIGDWRELAELMPPPQAD